MSARDAPNERAGVAPPPHGPDRSDARSPVERTEISRERVLQTRSALARSGRRYHETRRMLDQLAALIDR